MKVFFDVITNHTADVIDYQGGQYDYRSKAAYPYLDSSGRPFDDSAYADGSQPFPKVTTASFPYQPIFDTPADATVKKPDWLNDPTMYHNRGNSTFSGESGDDGDFSGLDDLWTERPEVVKGMEQIYESWVDFGVDGYRIDTVKNVDLPFWTQWSAALKAYAAKHGKPNFFMFGEVYDSDPAVQPRTSPRASWMRPSTSRSRTPHAPMRLRALLRSVCPRCTRKTRCTPPPTATPTSSRPSWATTTWAASAPSSPRTTRTPPRPTCSSATCSPTS